MFDKLRSPDTSTPETEGALQGGTIQYVEVSVSKEHYRDLELEMAAAMSVD